MTSYFDHFIVTQIITNYFTDSVVILLSVIMLYSTLNKSTYDIPSRFQSFIELIVDHWKTVVSENLGDKNNIYLLPLLSLFIFIFGINLLGFFTYTFPVTTHIFITFGMAFSV